MAKEKNKDAKKKVTLKSKTSSVSKSTGGLKKTEKQIKVRQTKSAIGKSNDQKRTLVGLKLNKINRVAILEDTSAVRGMINKVKHLVRVEKL